MPFEQHMQRRLANIAIGTSTVRGNPAGTKERVRNYLANFNLGELRQVDNDGFAAALNRWTNTLREAALLPSAQHWGVARKCLNIFLRDTAYNYFFREMYQLERMEPLLEVPLDNIVARRLKQAQEDLPRFRGIIHLTPILSEQYQRAAQAIADAADIARVHLDLLYWNVEG